MMWWTGKKLFLLFFGHYQVKNQPKKILDQRTAKYKNKYKYKPWARRFLINALPALRMVLCPRTSLPSSHTKKNILYIYWIQKIYYLCYICCILYIYYMNYIYKACLFTSNPLKMENWSGVTDPSRTYSRTIKIELVNFSNNRKFKV